MKINLAVAMFIAVILTGCSSTAEPAKLTKANNTKEGFNYPPQYPAESARTGQEGKVVLRVLVSESGDPKKIEIQKSSGFSRLDKAALNAVQGWRFNPAIQNGKPVEAWTDVPIEFMLGTPKSLKNKN